MSSTINIFHFNPTCELAVANGSPYYQPPAILKEFKNDLAGLMLWFAKKDDIVICHKTFSQEALEQLDLMRLNSSSLKTRAEAIEEISERKYKTNIFPWGWSPAEQYFVKNFKWTSDYNSEYFKKRYERKNAVELLRAICKESPGSFIISENELPVIVSSVDEIETMLQKWPKLVLKAPLSSSGRGLQIIRKKALDDSKKQWIKTILEQQNYLICEPLLKKVADLSFQYKVDSKKEISYLGISYFNTNNNGQYQGHLLNTVPNEIETFKKLIPENYFDILAENILEKLKQTIFLEYESYIGVDAMLYKDEEDLKLQPCIEINPRCNMGILSMEIQKKVHPDSKGYFEIYNGSDYSGFFKRAKTKNPPILMDEKLKSGFFSLTDINRHQRFGAFINLNDGQ